MMKNILNIASIFACTLGGAVVSPCTTAAAVQDNWQQLTTIGGGTQSRLAISHWPS